VHIWKSREKSLRMQRVSPDASVVARCWTVSRRRGGDRAPLVVTSAGSRPSGAPSRQSPPVYGRKFSRACGTGRSSRPYSPAKLTDKVVFHQLPHVPPRKCPARQDGSPFDRVWPGNTEAVGRAGRKGARAPHASGVSRFSPLIADRTRGPPILQMPIFAGRRRSTVARGGFVTRRTMDWPLSCEGHRSTR